MLKKINLQFVNAEIEKEYYEWSLEAIKRIAKMATGFFTLYYIVFLVVALIRILFHDNFEPYITAYAICLVAILILYICQKYSAIIRANFGMIYGLIMFISITENCIYLNKAFPLQQ